MSTSKIVSQMNKDIKVFHKQMIKQIADTMIVESYKRYLKTLRLLPPMIVQSMATRLFVMDSGESCLVGWAVREQLLASCSFATKIDDGDISDIEYTVEEKVWNGDPVAMCAKAFGGQREEWEDIFHGVINQEPEWISDFMLDLEDEGVIDRDVDISKMIHPMRIIEEAFMQRVLEVTPN